MDMIQFIGLNCYHGCIINAANFLQVDYLPSFSTLWSETDFSYDAIFHMYLTKRMLINLENLGIKLQKLPCTSPKENVNSFNSIKTESWFMGGIDAFHLPWNEYYQTLNGYHYFLGQKKSDGLLYCFDPMYNKGNIYIKSKDIMPYVFDILSINTCHNNFTGTSVLQEAHNFLEIGDGVYNNLVSKISKCTNKNRNDANQLAIYIDGMTTNRYLYRHYLQSLSEDCSIIVESFSDDIILQWISVKNGLLKASLISDNEDILEEICIKLAKLFNAEICAAKQFLQ